ncbi:MAG: hypothetical protein ACODAA_09605 [Gemmatimonadota bacterium]
MNPAAPGHPVWLEMQAVVRWLDALLLAIVDALAPWAPVALWAAGFTVAGLVLRSLGARRTRLP